MRPSIDQNSLLVVFLYFLYVLSVTDSLVTKFQVQLRHIAFGVSSMAAANESSGSPTTPSAKSAKPTKPSEPSFTKKDIWTLVKERKAALAKKPGGTYSFYNQYARYIGEKELIPQESNVLIVGNKYGGKSSLLARFLDRSETKSATIALEYSYIHTLTISPPPLSFQILPEKPR